MRKIFLSIGCFFLAFNWLLLCGQLEAKDKNMTILGKWRAVSPDGTKVTYFFKENNVVLWTVETPKRPLAIKAEYTIDYSTTPIRLNIFGFQYAQIKEFVLYGIVQFESPNKMRMEGKPVREDMKSSLKIPTTFGPDSLIFQRTQTKSTILSHKSYEKAVKQLWAVIIGISQYKYSNNNGLANLVFADNDAKAFAKSLQNLGWNESHIKVLINEEATQRNIMIALKSWLTKAGPNDQIILFWAGHGYPDPEDPEKVYFATYDTEISIPATGYRMDEVRRALEEIGSKNVVLLADTCHAGKLITRGKRGISIVPKIEQLKQQKQIPKGWVFMVGADTDRQAIEHSSWSNGAFTHSLLKGIAGEADGFQSAGVKDGIVTLGELKEYMNISMPDETQKVLGVAKRPVITTSTGDPDIWNLTLQVKK